MRSRHRNVSGSGYRSNIKRLGGDRAGSRISPEGPVSGHRMHHSEYRNHYRGSYGRSGQLKQFQSPMPAQRKTDILMEAGRLAAEYLVSKGVIPPDALSGKCQNDDLETQVSNSEGFGRPKVENEQSRKDGRGSARSHALDAEPGRRRYSDEHYSKRSKKSKKESRTGSFNNHGSEMNKELAKSRSWATWRRFSPGRDSDNDGPIVGKDGNCGVHNSSPGEITKEGVCSAFLESGWEKWNSVENEVTNSNSFAEELSIPSGVNVQPTTEPDDTKKFNAESGSVKERRNDNDLDQINGKNDEITAYAKEDNLVCGDNVNLVKYSNSGNVLTKHPSSLMIVDPNSDQEFMNEGDTISERELSRFHAISGIVHTFMSNVSSHQNHELRNPESDTGGKRGIDDDTDGRESIKRQRERVHTMDDQCDGTSPISSSLENKPTRQDPVTTQSASAALSDDQESLDISLFRKGHGNPREFMKEKRLFPCSFKTCDLTLGGIFDVNENHDVANRIPVYTSVGVTGKEAAPVDVDLSILSNCNPPTKNSKFGVNDNEIVYTDSEDEAVQDDKSFSNPERRMDMGLDIKTSWK